MLSELYLASGGGVCFETQHGVLANTEGSMHIVLDQSNNPDIRERHAFT